MSMYISLFFLVICVHRSFEIIFLLICYNKELRRRLIELGVKILRVGIQYTCIKYSVYIIHIVASDDKRK